MKPSLSLACLLLREFLSNKLQRLLERVDSSHVTTKQKVKLYKDGIFLAWGFRVLELPISWVLESKANRFLKKMDEHSTGRKHPVTLST